MLLMLPLTCKGLAGDVWLHWEITNTYIPTNMHTWSGVCICVMGSTLVQAMPFGDTLSFDESDI